jgi:UDP-N-acetylmuramoyl-tripeptide--D-alanyl-D-alanine ligase
MKKTLEKILRILAILTIKRYKPRVVGITGSVGKTSTKDAVYVVLSKKFNVGKTEKSFNNEIGFPLTILGEKSYGKNMFAWILVFLKSILKLIYTKYPEILVLEYGVDKPGDMEYLLSIAKPNIAVVTAIGEFPVHIENFQNKKALVKEKTELLKYLTSENIAVLNKDDNVVFDMRNKTKANTITFGFSKDADFKIFEPEKREDIFDGSKTPLGISFKIEYKGVMIPVRLDRLYGSQSAYAAGIACLVGSIFGINLVEVSEALKEFKNPPGRLNLIEGMNNTFILDDTYNASLLSMEAGLAALKDLDTKRKVAVLGSMLELGEFSEKAHKKVGEIASSFCDIILTVGKEAENIYKEAKERGFKNVYHFDSSDELVEKIEGIIQPGDLIFVKGSQGVRLEKIVKKIMAHPEDAEKLLVRQERGWV